MWFALWLACVPHEATSPAVAAVASRPATPTYLFDAALLAERGDPYGVPKPVGDTRFQFTFVPGFELYAPVTSTRGRAELHLTHLGTGSRVDVVLVDQPWPGADAATEALRGFMAATDVSVQGAGEQAIAAHGVLDGHAADGVVWWPADYGVWIRVRHANHPYSGSQALHRDLTRMIAGIVPA